MSWSLKKWLYIDLFFLEKIDKLSESVTFGQKLRYFTDQNDQGEPRKNEF